jgi:hypothetical protein
MNEIVFTHAICVNDPGDLPRLRLALARRPWAKQHGRALIDKLANELLQPMRFARCALPDLKSKSQGVPAGSRKRKPGGGRKRNEAKAILAPGVKKAMQSCGLPTGVWHRRGTGEASPYLQTIAICWRIASGRPANPKDDLTRLVSKQRRWEFIPAR